MQSNVLTLKCLRPHSSTHVPLHLRYAITIILALTRAPHSQLFNKLCSTSINCKSLFYIPLLLHLLSLYFVYIFCLCTYDLINFYLSSHSCFCFSLALFVSFFFFFFFKSFFIFFSFFIIISFSFSLPSLFISLSLSPSLSLAISPYSLSFIFFSFLFLYPQRFFLTLLFCLLFSPLYPPMEVKLLRGKTKLTETCYEILAGKVMTTYATMKSSIQFPSRSRPCRRNDRGDDDSPVSAHLEKHSIDQCIFRPVYIRIHIPRLWH